MKRDDVNINKIIEEAGMLSRIGARTKAAGSAVKQGVGNVAKAALGQDTKGWKGTYTNKKQENILKTLSNDIVKDLTKLGLVPSGSTLNPAELQNTLTQYISQYTGVGSNPTAPASTSSAPASPAASVNPASVNPASVNPASVNPASVNPAASAEEKPEEKPEETPVATPAATPEQPIPIGSTVKATVGGKEVVYRYSSPKEVAQDNRLTPNLNANTENAKWYILSKPNKKTGQSSMAFDDPDTNDPDIQSSISKEWKNTNSNDQQKQKQAKTPVFKPPVIESFKNYFWK
jgi:hypothetical protein